MGKKALFYGVFLIGLYIGVEYYTGLSKDIGAASTGSVNVIKAFQGRS